MPTSPSASSTSRAASPTRSTAACSASPTRCSCSHRETSKCQPRSARACSSAAASSTRRREQLNGAELSRMGGSAMLGLLYDAISNVESFLQVFVYVYSLLILAFIITSWVRLPYSVWLNRIQRFLYDVCDPYLRLWRRFLPTFGPLDLSPVIGVAALYILLAVVINILDRLH